MGYLAEPARSDEVDILYDADRASLGYVANYSKVFAHRPRVYRAWKELNGAVKATMDPVRYEVATVAAARELRSSYCSLAHGSVLARQVGIETAIKIASDESTDPLHAAIGELARKVAASPADITEADLKPLRDLGLSDVAILDVVLAAAARCFFSSVLEATGAVPDSGYANLDESLREVLTVGRPIEQGGT
jgi:uncharacterized peroxidase-related enzyme